MWMWYVGGAVVLVLVVGVFIWWRRRTPPLTAMVIFRSRRVEISEADVRAAHRRVFQSDCEVHRIPFPDGKGVGFAIVTGDHPPVSVFNAAVPYMSKEEAQDVAERHEHPAVRSAMTEHVSWTSVDAMGDLGGLSKEQVGFVHAMLGRLLAEFLDESAMLLYLTRTGRVAQIDDQTEAQLKAGDIQGLFGDDTLHAPMVPVAEDDEAINRAIAAAKSRLPEFVMAFERLGAKAEPLFKAHYKEAKENIWLELVSIEDDTLRGTIANEPIHTSIPRKGEIAAVHMDNVIDWAYLDDKGNPQGMFVDSILMKRKR
jgi:uncharacterized protein YegJ (DUF2314 family)